MQSFSDLPEMPEVRELLSKASDMGFTTGRISRETGVHYNTVRYIRERKTNPSAMVYRTLLIWFEANNIIEAQ